MTADRLVLGTAQMGMRYGIANRRGKPDAGLAAEILSEAYASGIREIDTAQAYGDSESVLGRALAATGLAGKMRVISKLDPGVDAGSRDAVTAAARASLARLGCDALACFMLHDQGQMAFWDAGLGEALLGLRRDGLVSRLGVSVHTVIGLHNALQNQDFSSIQFPANIVDGRFWDVFSAARPAGVTPYVRSVYLQGLLLLDPETLSGNLVAAASAIRALRDIAAAHGLSVHETCMAYVRARLPGARVVIGVETPRQVAENAALWKKPDEPDIVAELATIQAGFPRELLDPWNWRPSQSLGE